MGLPVEDIVAIEQLVARYNHAIDAGDGDGYAATFLEDGCFQIAGREPVRGRAALAEMVRRTTGRVRHFVSNLLIEGEGDAATMRAYLDAIPRGGGAVGTTGVYEDTLRRVDGRWLFVERRFTPDRPPEAK